MKLWHWILIGIIGTVSLWLFFIIVPVAVFDQSWWWFFAPFMFTIFVWIVVGIILLILYFSKRPPIKEKIAIKDALERAIYETKYDLENADNLKIEKHIIRKIGEKGTEPTPVLIIYGRGTEKNQKRIIIYNLNDPKKESTKLIDPSDEQVDREANFIADRPPEEIREETTLSIDAFGRPTTTTKVVKPSSSEMKLKKEQEEAEEKNLM